MNFESMLDSQYVEKTKSEKLVNEVINGIKYNYNYNKVFTKSIYINGNTRINFSIIDSDNTQIIVYISAFGLRDYKTKQGETLELSKVSGCGDEGTVKKTFSNTETENIVRFIVNCLACDGILPSKTSQVAF